jgi:tetratricopeptide (TPR) repeat protein
MSWVRIGRICLVGLLGALCASAVIAADEKIEILKKDGSIVVADSMETQGSCTIAYQDGGKLILATGDIVSTRKILVKPRILTRPAKRSRVVFEKPESFRGTTGHFKLFSERERVPREVFDKALFNLETVLNDTRSSLQKMAWKSVFTMEDARFFANTMTDVFQKRGYVYHPQMLLAPGLAEKKIDCDLYCLLYISAAESAGMRPGTITMLTVIPGKGKAIKVLSGGKYVELSDKAIGHAYLRFHLSPKEDAIIETTNGKIYSQPLAHGEIEEAIGIPKLQGILKNKLTQDLCQQALKSLTEKEYDSAIRTLEGASGVSLTDDVKRLLAYAYLQKACIFANRGDTAQAASLVEKALKLEPQHSYGQLMKQSLSKKARSTVR